jgi:hypothetical protein
VFRGPQGSRIQRARCKVTRARHAVRRCGAGLPCEGASGRSCGPGRAQRLQQCVCARRSARSSAPDSHVGGTLHGDLLLGFRLRKHDPQCRRGRWPHASGWVRAFSRPGAQGTACQASGPCPDITQQLQDPYDGVQKAILPRCQASRHRPVLRGCFCSFHLSQLFLKAILILFNQVIDPCLSLDRQQPLKSTPGSVARPHSKTKENKLVGKHPYGLELRACAPAAARPSAARRRCRRRSQCRRGRCPWSGGRQQCTARASSSLCLASSGPPLSAPARAPRLQQGRWRRRCRRHQTAWMHAAQGTQAAAARMARSSRTNGSSRDGSGSQGRSSSGSRSRSGAS